MKLLPHLDDVGMSAGSVDAWSALTNAGIVRSASVMVPCPFYPMARDQWRENPERDTGVHITLTSEWSKYRWRPLTGRSGGLVDAEGFFHRRPEQVLAHADPIAVADEMAAQIDRVLADGLRPTHIDAHMGTALLDPFIWSLMDLGKTYDLPVLVCRDLSTLLSQVIHPGFDLEYLSEVVQEAMVQKWPVFDHFMIGFCPDDQPMQNHLESLLKQSSGELVFYALHADTAIGMDRFAPHHAKPRRKEFELFSTVESSKTFAERQIELVTWRDLVS